MKDTLISYETALLADILGFKQPIGIGVKYNLGQYYNSVGVLNGDVSDEVKESVRYHISKRKGENPEQVKTKIVSAPTQSLLQKWLREEMDMWVTIIFNGITYSISIYGRYTPDEEEIEISNTGSLNFEDKYFLRYEQALEVGLQETLKLIDNERTTNII